MCWVWPAWLGVLWREHREPDACRSWCGLSAADPQQLGPCMTPVPVLGRDLIMAKGQA